VCLCIGKPFGCTSTNNNITNVSSLLSQFIHSTISSLSYKNSTNLVEKENFDLIFCAFVCRCSCENIIDEKLSQQQPAPTEEDEKMKTRKTKFWSYFWKSTCSCKVFQCTNSINGKCLLIAWKSFVLTSNLSFDHRRRNVYSLEKNNIKTFDFFRESCEHKINQWWISVEYPVRRKLLPVKKQ
jgi:hypothetical protein